MKKLLVVVDMQNDFIDGALGTEEAKAIVPNVVTKISEWDGDIIVTQDTHTSDYLNTREGKYLPVEHCICFTNGHKLNDSVFKALSNKTPKIIIEKPTFGSKNLPKYIQDDGYEYIELVGLCTDICVVSNAMLLKTAFPETDIAVDASCCAGVTPESHKSALLTMKMCQIDILNGD